MMRTKGIFFTNYLKLFGSITIAFVVIYGVAKWWGIDSFMFAWVLNFMLMMCLLAYTTTFKPKLTSEYFNLKKWERDGKTYTFFGVNYFRKLLVWSGWEKLNKKDGPVNKSSEALKNLEYATRQSEFGHLVIFVLVWIFIFYIAYTSGIKSSAWLVFLNIALNIYPIMVQRYNRPRLKRLLSNKRGP